MFRLLLLLCLISFQASAQSFLGKSQVEILEFSKTGLKNATVTFDEISRDSLCIKVVNKYETLYYFLVEDTCIEFMVVKPYSCNCLENDITQYNTHLISLGKHSWMSKDMSTHYRMILDKRGYAVSVVKSSDPLVFLTQEKMAIFK